MMISCCANVSLNIFIEAELMAIGTQFVSLFLHNQLRELINFRRCNRFSTKGSIPNVDLPFTSAD